MEHSNVGHAQRRRMVSAFWSITCNDRIATDNCWCLRLELLRKDNDLKIEWNTDFKNITNTTQRMTPTTARYVVKSWWQGVLVTHTQMNRVILKSYYWKDVVQPFQGQPQRGRLQWCWETVWEKTISVLHERVSLQMHSYLQITSWCLKQRLVREVNQWIWLRHKGGRLTICANKCWQYPKKKIDNSALKKHMRWKQITFQIKKLKEIWFGYGPPTLSCRITTNELSNKYVASLGDLLLYEKDYTNVGNARRRRLTAALWKNTCCIVITSSVKSWGWKHHMQWKDCDQLHQG